MLVGTVEKQVMGLEMPSSKGSSSDYQEQEGFEESKKSSGAPSSEAGGDKDGQNRRDKKNKDKSTAEYKRKVWEANGMKLVNGVLHVNCAISVV
jgi:hypothetical protein